MYSTDNGAESFAWPDGGSTPFRGEKNENWEAGYRVPCAIGWPGVIAPGTVNNDLFSHEDMLPTLLAAAGVPDVKEKLLTGMKVGKKTFKVHLDGYNITDRLMGKGPNPRNEFFYWNDDGSLVALRYGNWKIVLQEQRAEGFDVWQEPFVPLRLPKIINLRSDPFERAEKVSMNYGKWRLDRGRAGIYILQEFCRRIGIQSSDDEIRDLVVALGALRAAHPLARLLFDAPDFRQEAALADALLNPQDRSYSVPQLFYFISGAGLTFSRWVRQAPYSPRCGVMAQLPHASRIAALDPAQQYAVAELFRGTMMSHSVIVCRDDRAGSSQGIGFSGDAWLDSVPVRVPDTLCVQERLPPGAAAVLINRAHTNTDIYMQIDAREKRLVDAIDGERSIGEVAGEQPEACRALFERLWWHDQVVFDGSRRR